MYAKRGWRQAVPNINTHKSKEKAPKSCDFGTFLELLARFELATSSLPKFKDKYYRVPSYHFQHSLTKTVLFAISDFRLGKMPRFGISACRKDGGLRGKHFRPLLYHSARAFFSLRSISILVSLHCRTCVDYHPQNTDRPQERMYRRSICPCIIHLE